MPNLFPATVVFGVWGIFVGELSPYILMLFSISIGLVVDDSVHILSKYISGKEDGMSPENAAVYSLDRAGSAITITTLSLASRHLYFSFFIYTLLPKRSVTAHPNHHGCMGLRLILFAALLIKFDRWMDRNKAAKAAVEG